MIINIKTVRKLNISTKTQRDDKTTQITTLSLNTKITLYNSQSLFLYILIAAPSSTKGTPFCSGTMKADSKCAQKSKSQPQVYPAHNI